MMLQPVSDFENSVWMHGPTIATAYYWILYTVGIGICLWAFRKTKSKAYLVVAVFFLSPYLHRGFVEVRYQIHKEEYQRIAEEKNRELQDRLGRGEVPTIDGRVDLHLLETLLVLGLFFVGKSHVRNCNQVKSSE